MAASAFSQSLAFDPFTASLNEQQTYSDFSPVDLYSPLEDFGTDFTTDSAPSPGSPTSPVFANSYALPTDWMLWDKLEASPEPDDALAFLKTEPIASPIPTSMLPPRSFSLSPAINPLDLTNRVFDDVTFGREGINDAQPFFQAPSHLDTATSPEMKHSPLSSPEPDVGATAPRRAKASRSPTDKRRLSRGLKRKSTSSDSSTDSPQSSEASPGPPSRRRGSKEAKVERSSSPAPAAPKKTAHNMIEKRYRTNLNDKIAALRDSVPALRVMVHRLEHGGSGSSGDEAEAEDDDAAGLGTAFAPRGGRRAELDDEDLSGLSPAHKLNKATILSKATEYITHLERRNRSLAKENAALKGRVEGLEVLVMSRGGAQRSVWG